ncbi:hypothetical protein RU98_GL002342 [Enterococcus caccae]|nr:hypothetical protein RU98_GL002342 [Enterococcus caccae]
MPEFCDFGDWEVPVNNLSEIKQPNRDHAYILPDDSLWVLTHDGKRFTPINNGGDSGDSRPTQINNTDNYLEVSGSGTYSVTANLNTEKVINLVKDKIEIPEVTIATNETAGIVKPDGKTITISDDGVLSSVFPEAPLDGHMYARKEGKWVKNFTYPNVYYNVERLGDDQLTFNIAVKDDVQNYKVMFNDAEIPLEKRETSIEGTLIFDRTNDTQTKVQFYYTKEGIDELFYTLDLLPLFKLLRTEAGDSFEYDDQTNTVTFNETDYFKVEDSNVIKQGKTVFFSVNLTSIKAFAFSRNDKFKIGNIANPELFPRSRMAVNMVTENLSTAIYANTAIIIEKNGDIMLVNTSDVGIGSAYNFRVGNTHFINLTYVAV